MLQYRGSCDTNIGNLVTLSFDLSRTCFFCLVTFESSTTVVLVCVCDISKCVFKVMVSKTCELQGQLALTYGLQGWVHQLDISVNLFQSYG